MLYLCLEIEQSDTIGLRDEYEEVKIDYFFRAIQLCLNNKDRIKQFTAKVRIETEERERNRKRKQQEEENSN